MLIDTRKPKSQDLIQGLDSVSWVDLRDLCLFLFSVLSTRISPTQINISKSEVKISRLFSNSTVPLSHQLKVITHLKKKKILSSYPAQKNKGSLFIFNIFL